MQKHVKLYMDYFNYGVDDFIPCEVCGEKGVDIHHIVARGMGGTKKPDTINNLMALCRFCHCKYGDKKQYLAMLQFKHDLKLDSNL